MPDRMFCRSCCYELTGLIEAGAGVGGEGPGGSEGRCPECGRGYTPAMPRTWQSIPRSPFMQVVFGKGGAAGLALLVVAVSLWQTWLPRPDALDFSLPSVMRSWSLWRWMGHRFGWETTRLAGDPISVSYFADRAVALRGGLAGAGLAGGPAAWEVEDLGGGVARVSLHAPGCDYRAIVAAVRQCQPWPDEFWRFSRGRHRVSAGPGVFEGPWDEMVLWIADHFRLTQLPTVLGEGQTHLHVIIAPPDSSAKRVRRVSVEEARALGLDVRVARPGMMGFGTGP